MDATASIETPAAPQFDESGVDTQLVLETRNQIRALVDEVRRLSESDLPLAEFYDGLLSRVISALAASGGAVWTVDQDKRLQLACSANFVSLTGPAAETHRLLLQRAVRDRVPLACPPKSSLSNDQEAGNPTSELLLLAPIGIDQEIVGLLEILQRPGAGPATQRGYLRFLVQMCELAGGFVRNHRLRMYAERESLWKKLEQFLHELHGSLDLTATSLALVNEARLLAECDRVSLALRHGTGYRLVAISGLDNVDRRTAQANLLTTLVENVLATRESLWRSVADTQPLAPQIEQPLQAYIDRSHTKAVGIVPLMKDRRVADGSSPAESDSSCLGALVFEQLSDDRWTETLIRRADAVVHYATPAIVHAREHDRIFLRSLWTWLGDWRDNLTSSLRNRVFAGCGCALSIILALAIIPANFDVAARGNLEPSRRWEIFAPQMGTVLEVPVRHGQQVAKGDLLVQLASTEINVQLTELLGRQRVAQERLDACQRALLDNGHSGKPRLSPGDESRLGGEVQQLKQTLLGLASEIELVQQKQQSMAIRAEHPGEVVTWQVEQLLLRRSVQPGQSLLTVVDSSGPWELLLNLPERRLKHVDAQGSAELQVTFMLSTHPGREFHGHVVEIERSAEVRGEDGNTVLVRVALDSTDLPPLRSDTTLTAKIHCGRRSIGYVWFCDLIEAVQTKVLFWL